MKFQKWLQGIFGDGVLKAKRNQVAKLLAQNFLWERSGFTALHPDLQNKLNRVLDEMDAAGKPMYVFESFRSAKRQNELYNKGRDDDSSSIVTNAKAGQSYHQYCLAADVIFKTHLWNPPSELWWDEFGESAKRHGLTWGGDWIGFRDRPHVELSYAAWQELRPHFFEEE